MTQCVTVSLYKRSSEDQNIQKLCNNNINLLKTYKKYNHFEISVDKLIIHGGPCLCILFNKFQSKTSNDFFSRL